MALKLAKTTEEGFTIEYWRVNPNLTVDMVDQTATSTVLAYKDASARQAGKRPVHAHGHDIQGIDTIRVVKIAGTDFTAAMASGDFRPAMYAALKAKDFFSGAEDV